MKRETCCPSFNAEAWEGQVRRFDHLHFIRRRVACLWYIPLNFGPVVRRAKRTIEAHHAKIVDGFVFGDHRSPWCMDALIAIDKECEKLAPFTLDGEYLCAVYEGPHAKTAEFAKDFASLAEQRGVTIKRHVMYYPLCRAVPRSRGRISR